MMVFVVDYKNFHYVENVLQCNYPTQLSYIHCKGGEFYCSFYEIVSEYVDWTKTCFIVCDLTAWRNKKGRSKANIHPYAETESRWITWL